MNTTTKDPKTVWLVLGVLAIVAIGLFAVCAVQALRGQEINSMILAAATGALGTIAGTLIDPRSSTKQEGNP